ncbi:HCL453Wp [Eremothecium sinecaudum]|uniref:HCL453Wp n=1 Tax=Eremothecium sinecaudum TaxID=45286 RepID=A0A109UY58_9SACH|nr:HCL453Wp [Eremothecium sinecaudum]AMD19698.1 HCL453Wp [Eremothecium sinecaudum]
MKREFELDVIHPSKKNDLGSENHGSCTLASKRYCRDPYSIESWSIEKSSLLYNYLFLRDSRNAMQNFDYKFQGRCRKGSFREMIRRKANHNYIAVAFFNPHYVFTSVLSDILRNLDSHDTALVGVTVNGSAMEENCDFPIITNGQTLIRALHLLDPLGGGIYPMDCVLLFNREGHLVAFLPFSPFNRASFKAQLLNIIQQTPSID